jgi:hypothetical protein
MTTRFTAVAAALFLAAALPAAASAAQIQTDQGCYLDDTRLGQTIAVSGNGFEPSQPIQVVLDGKPLNGPPQSSDAAGGIALALDVPQLPDSTLEHRYVVTVTAGATQASAQFSASQFTADFSPSAGNPQTLKVRFSAYGFNAFSLTRRAVYVHYLDPKKKLRKTINLGRGNGFCGNIAAKKKRKLFPFKARRGMWQLQFDTNAKYLKPTKNFAYFVIGVRVKRVFG